MDTNKVVNASTTVTRDEDEKQNIDPKTDESLSKEKTRQDVPPTQDIISSSEADKSSPKDTTTVIENSNVLKPTETTTSAPQKDYSSFTLWEKRFIVFAATMGAFFSPFTAQIYFPALNTIAKDLNVSSSQINLTMTTYMVCSFFTFVIERSYEEGENRIVLMEVHRFCKPQLQRSLAVSRTRLVGDRRTLSVL